MANLVDMIKRDDSGAVDVTASLEAYELYLYDLAEKERRLVVQVSAAVNAVFDEFKGAAINLPGLASMTMRHLSYSSPAELQELTEAVKDYVRNHPSEFVIAKGKGGGCKRICDIPPEKA